MSSLPSAPDSEKSTLSILWQWPEETADHLIGLGLRPEHFSVPAHGELYRLLCYRQHEGKPVDLVAVTEALREAGKLAELGGAGAITKIYTHEPSRAHLDYHASRVIEHWQAKSAALLLQAKSVEILDKPQDCPLRVREAVSGLEDIEQAGASQNRSEGQIGTILDSVLVNLQARAKGESQKWIPSPWDKIKSPAKGLVVVGARPGMGKTAFLLNWLEHIGISHGQPACFISLEMDEDELGERDLASRAGVKLSDRDLSVDGLTKGEVQRIKEATEQAANKPLYLKAIPGGHHGDVCQLMRTMHRQHGVTVFALDYLQLIEPMDKSEGITDKRRIDTALRAINATRKQLGVTVILAAQTDREADNRPACNCPMAFLSDTSQTEKDADQVIFLGYRPAEHDPGKPDDCPPIDGKCPRMASIVKNRGGQKGSIKMDFHEEWTRWEQAW